MVRALDYLSEKSLLEVRAAGLRHPYRWLRPPGDLDERARSLHHHTLDRETREIARLDQVLTLAAHDGCQTAFLAGPRALTRFLTGLPSPRQTRGKLKSHPLFGAFAQVPFAEVLRRVEEKHRAHDASGSPGTFA